MAGRREPRDRRGGPRGALGAPSRSTSQAAAIRAAAGGAARTLVGAVVRGAAGAPPQISDVMKKTRRSCSAIFGLGGPSAGPGSAKKRLGMKSGSWGKGRDFQAPRIGKNTTSEVWVGAPAPSTAAAAAARAAAEALGGRRRAERRPRGDGGAVDGHRSPSSAWRAAAGAEGRRANAPGSRRKARNRAAHRAFGAGPGARRVAAFGPKQVDAQSKLLGEAEYSGGAYQETTWISPGRPGFLGFHWIPNGNPQMFDRKT